MASSFNKALYKMARRQTGCPACIAFLPTPKHWGWFAEVKDGSFSMEQFKAEDMWDAKYQCVMGWAEKFSKEQPNGKE